MGTRVRGRGCGAWGVGVGAGVDVYFHFCFCFSFSFFEQSFQILKPVKSKLSETPSEIFSF